jgi:ferredoxin-thioredoxin reductase catalytic subunit
MVTHFTSFTIICNEDYVNYYINCSPTGRRNHGRPLKRLLDTWDRNGSTSGPTPWQIYDDDDDDDDDYINPAIYTKHELKETLYCAFLLII